MLLLIGVWVFFMRQMQGGSKGMGFGKSKAKLLSDKGPKITFADVAGIDEAKEELSEIVDFLRNPSKFQKLGGQIPKGCLLIGPPGTGKTLLAKAIAGEANVPFFSISGSDFVEMFVGVGASRVRDMFEQGKRNAPCIIFIDEFDAIALNRGYQEIRGDVSEIVNALLTEMDGIDEHDGICTIAATNMRHTLDPAIRSRFEEEIEFTLPNLEERREILKFYTGTFPRKLAKDVDIEELSKLTHGFSGRDLVEKLLKNALHKAILAGGKVKMSHFDAALSESSRKNSEPPTGMFA